MMACLLRRPLWSSAQRPPAHLVGWPSETFSSPFHSLGCLGFQQRLEAVVAKRMNALLLLRIDNSIATCTFVLRALNGKK